MVAEEPKVNVSGKYSTKQTADLLGYSERHISRLANDGLIKYHMRRNGRRYITGRDIVQFWKTY